jgi:hypothetical protein
MAKKLPYDEVYNRFKDKGYTLIEKKYTNSKTPMKYICPFHPNKELYISVENLGQWRYVTEEI